MGGGAHHHGRDACRLRGGRRSRCSCVVDRHHDRRGERRSSFPSFPVTFPTMCPNANRQSPLWAKLGILGSGGGAIPMFPRLPRVLRAQKHAPLTAARAPCPNAIFTGSTTPARPAEPRRGFARRGQRRRGARDRARRARVQHALRRRGRPRAVARGPHGRRGNGLHRLRRRRRLADAAGVERHGPVGRRLHVPKACTRTRSRMRARARRGGVPLPGSDGGSIERAWRRRRRSLARSVARTWCGVGDGGGGGGRLHRTSRASRAPRVTRAHAHIITASRASSPFTAPPAHDRHARAAAAAALARSLDRAHAVWRNASTICPPHSALSVVS